MTSPWNSVLNTNYAPTDDEATQIRGFCEKPHQKVCEIDREIQQLREKLDDLLHERDALVEILESHRALVSPIRRLSPELLQQIFLCCLPADRNPAVHPSEAPLLLGRICRLWREVANSTPQLWSAIHIVIPSNDNASLTSARYEALRTWLGRSGVTPLHISLRAHLPTEEILPFVDYIVALSTRWASVTLALPTTVILRLCSSVNGSVPVLNTVKFDSVDLPSIPALHHLNLQSGPESEPDAVNYIYAISQFVLRNPSIRHYSLTCQNGYQARVGLTDATVAQLFLSRDSPPSLKLETLSLTLPPGINFTGPQPILDLLSAHSYLKRCSLRCFVERGPSETSFRPKPVALHALEELTLGISCVSIGEYGNLLPDLFANLLLPRLIDMRLLSRPSDPARAFTSFTQLLIRSTASLKRLALHGCDPGAFLALIPVLEASPQLQELSVTEGNYPRDRYLASIVNSASSGGHKLGLGDQVLQVLSTPSASMTLLCPQLDKLTLSLSTTSQPLGSYLKSFFIVRRLSPTQCTPLSSISVRFIDGAEWPRPMSVPIRRCDTNDVKTFLDEMRQDGMTIDMSNPILKWVVPSSPYLGLETPDYRNDIVPV